MSDVLDQSEIDALLAAVDDGDEAVNPAEATPAATPKPSAQSNLPVSTYDFKRPERVSKDHIRSLASIHDGFARNFGVTLSGFLRTIIEMRVVGVEQLTYSEFIHSLPNPTCFVILRAPPLEGQMCLELSPLIAYPIIERLLGGNNAEMFIPQRPLTSIEWRLVQRLISRALDHLSDVWRNLVDAKFEMVATESNPQLVHIVGGSEVVVFITFEIKMGKCAGTMSMCIPFNTIESVLGKLTTQSWFGYKRKATSDLQRKRLMRCLHKSKVELRAYLGETRIKLSELRSLKPGNLLPLKKPISRGVILRVEGHNKFAASVGQFRGHRALRLTRPAKMDEPL